MAISPAKRRTNLRLAGYDYATAGAYFVTVCAHERRNLFGRIENGNMILNSHGLGVLRAWKELPRYYSGLRLDAFVIMPNHVHAIVILEWAALTMSAATVGAGLSPAPTAVRSGKAYVLGEIIRAFKAFASRNVNRARGTIGEPVWQRNYYERVIRHGRELNAVRDYIRLNPVRWEHDRENPAPRTQRVPGRV